MRRRQQERNLRPIEKLKQTRTLYRLARGANPNNIRVLGYSQPFQGQAPLAEIIPLMNKTEGMVETKNEITKALENIQTSEAVKEQVTQVAVAPEPVINNELAEQIEKLKYSELSAAAAAALATFKQVQNRLHGLRGKPTVPAKKSTCGMASRLGVAEKKATKKSVTWGAVNGLSAIDLHNMAVKERHLKHLEEQKKWGWKKTNSCGCG
jgi:hypothetical protein